MSLQRCLACNVKVSKSCKVCACGHVFEDMKQIGGKRFSGYRAQLYLRLESKRMKVLTGKKRNRTAAMLSSVERHARENNKESPRLLEPNVTVTENTQIEKKNVHEHKPKRLRRSASPVLPKATISFNRKESNPVPAEMIDRLPKALAEINRRLLGQNLMWIGLSVQ